MNTNATYENYKHFGPSYLKALNVQNAMGYQGSWREYELALSTNAKQIRAEDAYAYIGTTMLQAVLGELA